MEKRSYLGTSEIGMCSRRVFFAHSPDVVPEVSEEAERLMALGKLIERLRVRELRQQGIRVQGRQLEIRFGASKGHLDAWYRTLEGPLLLEIKSTSQFSISKWQRENLPRSYTYQIHGYAQGLSDRLGEVVRQCRLEVLDRVSGEAFCWMYELDPETTNAALERTEFLSRAIEEGDPPDREFAEVSPECQRCPFKSACRPGPARSSSDKEEAADASLWAGFPEAIELYASGQALKKEGEELASRAKDQVLDSLRHHNVLKVRLNGTLVSWSPVESSRLDSKALQAELPAIFSKYLKPSSYSRLTISERR